MHPAERARPRIASTAFLALLATAALLSSACTSARLAPRTSSVPLEARLEPSRFVVVTVRNDPHTLATHAGATVRGYESSSQYGATLSARTAVRALEKEYGLSEVSAWPIALLRVHCILFRVPADTTPTHLSGLIARLSGDPRVDSAQPLNEFTTEGHPFLEEGSSVLPEARYNDPYVGLQSSLRDLEILEAHRWSRGAGVRIAVIDTGVDFEHEDLKHRIVERRNFVDDDEPAFRLDRHGTEVAGVIAAVADNQVDIVGIAPEAQLLAFKACWQVSRGAHRAVCNSFTLAQALESAINSRANVVNLSLSGPADPLLDRLVQQGIARGILFVGAVAPVGVSGGFPAGVKGVLSVAQAEENRSLDARHLLAPGHEILTLVPNGRCDFASGSSYAAAQVSGMVALLLALRPRLSAEEVRLVLARTSQRVFTDSGSMMSVNACAALADVLKQGSCGVGGLRREIRSFR